MDSIYLMCLFALVFAFSFLFLYAFDDGMEVKDWMPKPKYPPAKSDTFDWEYIESVMLPGYEYFVLRGELCEGMTDSWPFSLLIVHAAGVLSIAPALRRAGLTLHYYPRVVIAVALVVVMNLLAVAAYRATLKIVPFQKKEDRSEMDTVLDHLVYLRERETTARRRMYMRKPLLWFAVAVYLFVFAAGGAS